MAERLKDQLVGPVFPIVTPFKENQTIEPDIDYHALGGYVDYLINGGAKVLMVASATSRFAQLSVPEIQDVNKFVIETVGDRALAIPSTPISGSTGEHVRVANDAKNNGANMIVCEYPWRYQSPEALIDYFKAVADTGLDIVLHVTPSRSEVKTEHGKTHRYDIGVVEQLLNEIPSVIGMKEASGEPEHSKMMWENFAERMNIIVAGRASESFLEAAPYGVAGFFSGAGSVFPEKDTKLYSLVRSGKMADAAELVSEYETPLLKLAKEWGWHASLKAVLAGMEIMEITERPPMVPVTTEQQKRLMEIANERT